MILESAMKIEAKSRLKATKVEAKEPMDLDIKPGAFHKWLGKAENEPITEADIAKGKAAGGHAAKMARFAENSRKWKHK
jgi:hypothetical protein